MSDVIDAIIEIPFGSKNKYEIDKQTGRIRLDRVLSSAMGYPTEYGIIPETLADDGDPLDILIIATEPTHPGCVVSARILGYLTMTDGGKKDSKLIAVVDKDPRFDEIKTIDNVSSFIKDEIKDFFENYKKLQGVEVIVKDYHSKEDALRLIENCKNEYLKK